MQRLELEAYRDLVGKHLAGHAIVLPADHQVWGVVEMCWLHDKTIEEASALVTTIFAIMRQGTH